MIPSFEGMLEVSYTAQIMQGLTLQPDFQYFWNPGGHSADPDDPESRSPTPPSSACAPPSTTEWSPTFIRHPGVMAEPCFAWTAGTHAFFAKGQPAAGVDPALQRMTVVGRVPPVPPTHVGRWAEVR